MTISTRAWLFVPSVVRMLVPGGKPGVYLLGQMDKADNHFVPHYVGRSDFDVRCRLAGHEKLPLATHFCVQLCRSAEEAFTRECFYWHALQGDKGLMNAIHPDSPNKTGLLCPYCTTADHFNRYLLEVGDRL